MKKIKRLKMALVILGGMSMIFTSCSEDDLAIQGCTDITATNYIVSATVDDGTCSYLSDLFIGEYSIEDSIMGGMIADAWSAKRNYNIEISQDPDYPNQIIIKNWAKIYVSDLGSTEDFTQVIAQVDGDSLFVSFQEVSDTDGYHAHTSNGKVTADSIFFNFEYENWFGEVFWGYGRGKRLE